jgi:hypothetical protein
MGFRFRRVFPIFGGARVNLSKRGVGASWGIPGFRFGVAADGRRYLWIGVPGSGFYYVKYFGRKP